MTNDPSLMQTETRNSFLPNSPPAVPSHLSRTQYPSLLRMLLSAISAKSARELSVTGVR
jgi:hypothetical protein